MPSVHDGDQHAVAEAARRRSTSVTKNGSAVAEIVKTVSAAIAPPSVIASVAVAGEEGEAVAGADAVVAVDARAAGAPAARARRAPTTTNDSASIDEREPQQPGRAEQRRRAAGRR